MYHRCNILIFINLKMQAMVATFVIGAYGEVRSARPDKLANVVVGIWRHRAAQHIGGGAYLLRNLTYDYRRGWSKYLLMLSTINMHWSIATICSQLATICAIVGRNTLNNIYHIPQSARCGRWQGPDGPGTCHALCGSAISISIYVCMHVDVMHA